MNLERKIRLFKYLILFVILSLLIYFLGSKIKADDIALFVVKTGIWGPVIYIILMSVTYIVPPLSGTPLFLAGYPLFGKQMIFYIYFAALISSVINFWIARIWGRKIVIKFVGQKNMGRIDQFAKDYGLKTLVFLRVFQGYLFDFVSYAYGLTKMKFFPYLIVCIFAPIPWWAVWYFYFFGQIGNLADFTFWFLISMVPFYFVSLFFIVKLRKNRNG